MKTAPLFLSVLTLAALPAGAEGRKPNILLIVADDLGYGELGVQGFAKDIPTPNIDSIAKNGTRFTNGYVSGPYCSPTRAALLTGHYQQRFGHEFNPGPPVQGNEAVGLSLQEKTIGDRLKAAGYATGWFGKSHLGNAPEFHPLKRGFDQFYGFLGGAHSYIHAGEGPNAILRGTEVVKDPGYLTEDFAREAVRFIGEKKDQPWFVYLPFNAVHAPLETLEKYESRFTSIADPQRRHFAALLSALDDNIGNVLGKVRELNLEEDTLIYFISDNGGPTPSTTSGNGPLRGYKAQTWEGGIRVPFAIQWKGRIPAGKVDDRPVIQLDLLPTSLAAAGIEADPAWKLDGVNLLPYLTVTDAKTEAPHDALFWRFGQQIAVRRGDWKLVKAVGGDVERGYTERPASVEGAQLYNLAEDIGEKNDLAAKNPEKLKELAALWNDWNAQLVAPKWRPNAAPRGDLPGRRAERNEQQAEKSNATVAGPWKSGDVLTGDDSPKVAGHGFTLSARVESDAPDGVIVAQGGTAFGYALHVQAGKLVLSARESRQHQSVTSTAALPAGNHKVEVEVAADGAVTFKLDGNPAGQGKLPGPLGRQPGEGLTVGNDGRLAVGEYTAPHPFAGKVSETTVTVR